ncbi:MAG: twin-arginine translocation signal domain-containing protein [Odoribacter splanchnicus]
MVTRRDFIKKSGLAIAAAAMSGSLFEGYDGNNGQGSGVLQLPTVMYANVRNPKNVILLQRPLKK